eukprot:1078046-Rhodomonas_salina.1
MPVPSRQVSTGYQCSHPRPLVRHPVAPPSNLPLHPPSPGYQSVSIGPRPPAHPGPFQHPSTAPFAEVRSSIPRTCQTGACLNSPQRSRPESQS